MRPEVLLSGLPAEGAHPLKELAFAPDGRLFVNIGSATDACRQTGGAQPWPCPETQGAQPRAAVWVAHLGGPQHTVQRFEPYARGLRNSLALAWVPTAGALLQGENNIDYPDREQPPEELNVLRAGADFGWPGCVGRPCARARLRGPRRLHRHHRPARLWPAHAAPLQMLLAPARHRRRWRAACWWPGTARAAPATAWWRRRWTHKAARKARRWM